MVFIMGSPNIVNLTATRLVSEPAFVRIPKPQRTCSLENNLRCAEVVSEDSGLKSPTVYVQRPPSTEAPSSRSLKFGVDRILSDEIAPNKKTSDKVPSLPPCSECVSSLLRCCRLSGSSEYYRPYYSNSTVLHTPKPIRPYTNLILESDVSDRGSLTHNGSLNKRKRSWSRAVFSNLQRKGLEKRFQIQKYITKPDRRQLAATLGLTDAQVKVWFQNRRMKWRHSKELKFHSGTNFQASTIVDSTRPDVKPSSPPIHDDSKDRK